MSEEFLSIEEVASRLGVSRRRVYQLTTREGQIPHVKIGRLIRIPVSAWNDWVSHQGKTATAKTKEMVNAPSL